MPGNQPFWREKTLLEMTAEEWESLCDGCGRCCLVKLEDEDTSRIHFTDLSCKLFDVGTCRCNDYENRTRRVDDCVKLTPDNVAELNWLPATCAYRLVAAGRPLRWWHPLVSGDPGTVVEAGISVKDKVASEVGFTEDEWESHIWRLPKAKASSCRD
jgi:uncharacterized cysteine cluster protein YcgN (CxxCxxCC family)